MSWKVPNDSGKFILGHPKRWPEEPMSIDSVNASAYIMKAYPMHERCWVLMTRILDVGLTEKNFNLFTEAQKKHSRENGLVKGFLIDEKCYWRAPDEEHKDLSWTDPEGYARICEKEMSHIEGCLDLSCASRDPFNIPELPDLLSHPENLQRSKQRKLEPKPAKTAAQEPCSYPNPTSFRVSSEIILMIMDYLHEDNDIYALLRLFPIWRSMVSQATWRRICIKDLLLEEPLPHVNALDWRYLYYNIYRLLRKSHGWYFDDA